MNFQFLFPRKIILEKNSSFKLGKLIHNKFSNPLIITGSSSLKKSGNYDKIIDALKNEGIKYSEYSGIKGEPTPQIIDDVTDYALKKDIKSIISIGGGSVIDTGKAVSALVVNKKGVENYLEGVGNNYQIKNNPLPFIAVPTTSGSGAEATKNAVVTSREKKYKKSFRDERLVASMIIVDPMLTKTLPRNETAFGGMDAICQLIESFVSKKRNIFAMSLSSFFIPKAIDAIIDAYNNPGNIESRIIMSASSLSSGLALANSGLGAVHGFASGLGGMFNIPHGLICAVLLPGVCKMNSEESENSYRDLAKIINQDNSDDVNKMVDKLYELNDKLKIPQNFKEYNISKNNAEEIVDRSFGSSMKGNPVDFSKEKWCEFIGKFL